MIILTILKVIFNILFSVIIKANDNIMLSSKFHIKKVQQLKQHLYYYIYQMEVSSSQRRNTL